MRRSRHLLIGVALALTSFALGAGLTLVHERFGERTERAQRSPRSDSAQTRALAADVEQRTALLHTLRTHLSGTEVARDVELDDPGGFSTLHQRAQTSAAARTELIERYRDAPEGELRTMLGNLLANLQSPEVLAFAKEQVLSNELTRRKEGFTLLATLGVTVPEVRQLARQALETETDPALLTGAIASMRPAPVEAAESAAVTADLGRLASHSDPTVRAQAVAGLANWDKGGESAGALQEALMDGAPDVRHSAISAIARNRIRSPGVKQTLLAVARDPDEIPDIRILAARGLEHFSLDAEESAAALAAAREADAALYGESEQAAMGF